MKYLESKGFHCNQQNTGGSVLELKGESFVPSGSNTVDPNPTVVHESVASAKEFHKIPPYSPGFGPSQNFNPYQICTDTVDNPLQYAQAGHFPQGYSYKSPVQEFQYFVVIDFEATCDEGKVLYPQEIIEFPSVIVNGLTGQLEACFRTYVRPTCNKNLTDYCKNLTGIQQIQVDRGVTLSEALLGHDKWLEHKGLENGNFAVVTWGNWDCRTMLESECRYKNISKPHYFNRWINLKVLFQHIFGGGRYLKEAVEMSGLTWEGRPHCGLDDAKNTARLLSLLMHKGLKFGITNELEGQSPNNSAVLPHQHHSIFQFYPFCFCGVKSKQGQVRKPGPKLGSFFFGCGNWTPARGNLCLFFQWA